MTNWTPVQPLSDEPQDQRFWELQQFKIGDRVRVRLNRECNRNWNTESPDALNMVGHPDVFNGVTGTVIPAVRPAELLHHPIGVAFDREILAAGTWWPSGRFAACELEPLE